jgi:PleD family two-component response regulator
LNILISILSLLLADDPPLVQMMWRPALLKSGQQWQLNRVTDGVQAMHCLAEYTFELVILDIAQPQVDSLQLMKRMLRHNPTLNS